MASTASAAVAGGWFGPWCNGYGSPHGIKLCVGEQSATPERGTHEHPPEKRLEAAVSTLSDLPRKLTTRAQMEQFLNEHPDWVLQWQSGIRQSWWWFRRTIHGPDTVMCHATGARALSRMLTVIQKSYGETSYARKSPLDATQKR